MGESQVNIEESIRGKEVYILQSTSSPINDNLMKYDHVEHKASPVLKKPIIVMLAYYGCIRQD